MDREWNQYPVARFLSFLLFPWLWRALALDRAARQENDEQLDQTYLLLIENFIAKALNDSTERTSPKEVI